MRILEVPRDTTSWGIGLADSFRQRSRKVLGTWGGNLQNKPDNLRKLYEPDLFKCFLQADQSGAEALIVAYLCRDGNYRKLFKYGVKCHSYVAMNIFKDFWIKQGFPATEELCKLPIEQIAIHPEYPKLFKEIKKYDQTHPRPYYYIGKKTGHARNYRMKAPTFQMDVLKESNGKVVLSRRESELFLFTYDELFPEILEWHRNDIDQVLKTTKILYNLFGFPREFYEPFSNKLARDATSWIPQSTVATITNIAYCEIQDYIEKNHLLWDLLINNHDSILMQVPIPEKEQATKILCDNLGMNLVSFRGEPFKMKVEVAYGMNWGKYNRETNPDGMKEIE